MTDLIIELKASVNIEGAAIASIAMRQIVDNLTINFNGVLLVIDSRDCVNDVRARYKAAMYKAATRQQIEQESEAAE